MRDLTLIIAGLCIPLMIGCSGAGSANTAAGSADDPVNIANNIDDNPTGTGDSDDGNTDPGSDPVTPGPTPGPGPTPPPATTPQPGDIVKDSEGVPNVEYQTLSRRIQPAPDPNVEPNTDRIKPIISISKTPESLMQENAATIEFKVADNVRGSGVKGVQCKVNDGSFADCGTKLDLTDLEDGRHTVTALAEDWEENESTEVSYTFLVDTEGPQLKIVSGPPGATKKRRANFVFEATDLGTGVDFYQCRINGETMSRCEPNKEFTNVADGRRQIYVRAVDKVGNRSETLTYRWIVDNEPPVINILNQPPSTFLTGTSGIKLKFNASDALLPDGLTERCYINNSLVSCKSNQNIAVDTNTQGTYQFRVEAIDRVGNSASTTLSWTVLNESESRRTKVTVGEDRPVDLLFVIDNSGSMDFERSNLAERIDGMIAKLDGLDWQIAVTSTDSSRNTPETDGRLIEFEGLPGTFIIDSNMDVDVAQTSFGNTVQNMPEGSGNEEGIYSSKRVIERYLAGNQNHRQFLREGADLSIVVLSDEDESSNGVGVRITPQGFVDFVASSFNNQKNMVFHSIVTKTGDRPCIEGHGNKYGATYEQLSVLTGFGETGGAIIGSVCEEDYTSQLADIGQSVKDRQNSIELDCAPFDVDKDGQPDLTISYRQSANQAYQVYSADRQFQGSRVTFNDLLPPGDFRVDYYCKIN